ncbi:MAG: hypothetical protein LBH44_13670 [Treponema sp.]|jgi:hypothetical protein|nr:hypothetical protein [Treponema sp.]
MKKKFFVILVLAVVAGNVFAQPNNTFTVDLGPTVMGALIGATGDLIGENGVSTSGFGIAVQYERQLLKQFSVAGRFAYLGGGIGYGDSFKQDGAKIDTLLNINLSSFSLEAHARLYPLGDSFFLDGLLGFANMTVDFTGELAVSAGGEKGTEDVSVRASKDYFKFGTKLGWRITFGKEGGFVFEPAFGYYAGVSGKDSMGKQLLGSIDGDMDVGPLDLMFWILEDFVFIGGPRFTLSFGWRF